MPEAGVLDRLGWTDDLARAFEEARTSRATVPGRIVAHHRGGYDVRTADAEVLATPSGRFRHRNRSLPVTGDWVATVPTTGARVLIDAVLPRRTTIARVAAGSRSRLAPAVHEQVLATNVDVVFVAVSVNLDRIERRVERFRTLVSDPGIETVVLLTKADLAADADVDLARLATVIPGVLVLPTSTISGEGLGDVRAAVAPRRTGVLLGPSGVGKSSIINALVGDEVRHVGEIRSWDSRGRHTTAARELILLPGGGCLLDTPGLREVAAWEGAAAGAVFADVERLAGQCRFRDCAHDNEPGCAVLAAVEAGELAGDRVARYRAMRLAARARGPSAGGTT
ncbi:MAG TPA: ribosome small subunit-dependent GTPase A [Actinomycetota bacterium]